MPDENPHVPPGPLREFEFGDISTLAKLAQYIPGTPAHLYTFGARWVEFPDYQIDGPSAVDADDAWSDGHAWYSGSDSEVIVHFVEALHDVPPQQYAAQFSIVELHELAHWAAPEDDNPGPDDTDHWRTWNSVLADVVADVMEIDEWQVVEYEGRKQSPPSRPETEQTTLLGVH